MYIYLYIRVISFLIFTLLLICLLLSIVYINYYFIYASPLGLAYISFVQCPLHSQLVYHYYR